METIIWAKLDGTLWSENQKQWFCIALLLTIYVQENQFFDDIVAQRSIL